jgi:hypothetical protein
MEPLNNKPSNDEIKAMLEKVGFVKNPAGGPYIAYGTINMFRNLIKLARETGSGNA